MAITTNFLVNQGSSFTQTIGYTDDSGNPVNLTGRFLRGYIKESYSSTNAFALTLEYANINAGLITVSLNPTDTSYLDAKRYVYDIEGYLNSGNILRLFEGIVTVNPGTTSLARPTYIYNRENYFTANLIPKEQDTYSLGTLGTGYKNLYLSNARITGNGANLVLPDNLFIGTVPFQTAVNVSVNSYFGSNDLSNIIGQTGATGPIGPTGNTGATGPAGPQGPLGYSAVLFNITANVNDFSNTYTFSGMGINGDNQENPTIYVYKGFRYGFVNESNATYPMQILDSANGNVQVTGVVSANEIITLIVPFNLTGNLYYQSTTNPEMGGLIVVV
jgi:hypothetical protein